jgi:hypothetical protein
MTEVWLRTVNEPLPIHRRDGVAGMMSAQTGPAKLAWEARKNVKDKTVFSPISAELQ